MLLKKENVQPDFFLITTSTVLPTNAINANDAAD